MDGVAPEYGGDVVGCIGGVSGEIVLAEEFGFVMF